MMQTKARRRELDRKRKASLYYQRKSEGLCVQCGAPARPGSTRCQQCLAIQYQRVKKHSQSYKRKAVQYLGGKCVDCGLQTDFMSVYDFHHQDASTKKDGVASLIDAYKPWRVVQAELDKCVLLCANCHRIRHELEDNAP